MSIEGEVSNARLQEELETEHPAAITQVLQGLCAKGMLTSDNRRRWSLYKIPSSPHLTANSPHLEVHDLASIALPIAHSKKASKSMVCKAILELCSKEPLSLDSLAQLLSRDPKSLQNHYLTQLVAEGLLKLQYPDIPNHPCQAYIRPKHQK